MGLFLQKTNIIRDLLEDISEEPPRVWYPKEIWGLYTDDIQKFKTGEASKTQAVPLHSECHGLFVSLTCFYEVTFLIWRL